MSFDLDILNQGKIWRDSLGNVHRIADMDDDYRLNVVRMLERGVHLIVKYAVFELSCGYLPDENTMAYLSASSAIDRKVNSMQADRT